MFKKSFNKIVDKFKPTYTKSIKLEIDKDKEAKLLDFSIVKAAILSNDLSRLMSLYQKVLNVDLNISGSLHTRKNTLLSLPFVIEADTKERAVIDKMLENFKLNRLLNAIHNDIYYGISLQNIIYEVKDGLVLPCQSHTILPTELNQDSKDTELYIKNPQSKKIYLHTIDKNRLLIHTHPIDNADLANNSIAYKLLWSSILKHTVITLNLEFIDKAAVPPLLIKVEDLSDTKKADELFAQMMELKSTSVGMFTKDIELDTLKMDSKVQFDQLIEYIDKKQNELLLGGNLSSSSEKVGSQSLGLVHENRLFEIVKADSKLISETMTEFLNQVLTLNLPSHTPVEFSFTLPLQKNHEELKAKSEIINSLNSAGYFIPIAHIEKTFDIQGVTLKESKPSNNSIEFNSKQSKDDETKALEEEVLHTFDSLMKQCNSYEEVEELLLEQYNFMDTSALEEILLRESLQESIKGTIEVGNDAKE